MKDRRREVTRSSDFEGRRRGVIRSSRSEGRRISPIFDLRPRKSKNPLPIFDLLPRIMDRRSDRRRQGVRRLRKWEDGSSKMRELVDLPVPKNKEAPIFHLLGLKNENPYLPIFRPEKLITPSRFSSFDIFPLHQWSPPLLSYPEIWMFSPISHLEDRPDVRNRPSIRYRVVHRGHSVFT